MLVAGIALMIYCGPMGAAAMMALYGAIASTGFSMVLGGIAQKLQGQYSPAIGIAVKQPASPWNVVYGRSRVGGVIAYINTSSQQNTRLDLIVAHTGHHVARVGNAVGMACPLAGCISTARKCCATRPALRAAVSWSMPPATRTPSTILGRGFRTYIGRRARARPVRSPVIRCRTSRTRTGNRAAPSMGAATAISA